MGNSDRDKEAGVNINVLQIHMGFEGGWVVLDHIPIFTPVRTTKLSTTTVPSKPTPSAGSSKGLARYSNLTQCDIL